jgi:hypothetical protein
MHVSHDSKSVAHSEPDREVTPVSSDDVSHLKKRRRTDSPRQATPECRRVPRETRERSHEKLVDTVQGRKRKLGTPRDWRSASAQKAECPESLLFRVLQPWDLARDAKLDVLKHTEKLNEQLNDTTVSHWAPNCATFSRAREFPIPGVKNPPVPLRSSDYPEGLPDLCSSKRQRVSDDTAMAVTAAETCKMRHLQGAYFSLEHPLRSYARDLKSW